MILYTPTAGRIYVDRTEVETAEPATDSASWHGVGVVLRLKSGRVIEVVERIDEVLKLLESGP